MAAASVLLKPTPHRARAVVADQRFRNRRGTAATPLGFEDRPRRQRRNHHKTQRCIACNCGVSYFAGHWIGHRRPRRRGFQRLPERQVSAQHEQDLYRHRDRVHGSHLLQRGHNLRWHRSRYVKRTRYGLSPRPIVCQYVTFEETADLT